MNLAPMHHGSVTDARERRGRIVQIIGGLFVISAVIVGILSPHAGAASLTNDKVSIRNAGDTAVATNPLSNGLVVDIAVAPNSTMSRSSLETAGFPSGAVPIKVLECTDLGGLASNLPTKPSNCEPETVLSVAGADADGSLFFKHYKVYALPDPTDLGVSNGTTCDDAQHQCVLGLFSNPNDYTKPHIFSAPFQITAASAGGGSSTASAPDPNSASASPTVSPGVTLPATTLAYTGPPTVWPWLLGSGVVLIAIGTGLRLARRRSH